jgi:hypothetical protein
VDSVISDLCMHVKRLLRVGMSVRRMHVYRCGLSCNCMMFCDDLGELADRMVRCSVRMGGGTVLS